MPLNIKTLGDVMAAERELTAAAVDWRATPYLDGPISEGGSTVPWVKAFTRMERAIDEVVRLRQICFASAGDAEDDYLITCGCFEPAVPIFFGLMMIVFIIICSIH